jgi:hypothetical protein
MPGSDLSRTHFVLTNAVRARTTVEQLSLVFHRYGNPSGEPRKFCVRARRPRRERRSRSRETGAPKHVKSASMC